MQVYKDELYKRNAIYQREHQKVIELERQHN